MNSQERLSRVLGQRAAPAKDMHFTLLVMRRAEDERFRAAMTRRIVWGAALAAVAGLGLISAAGWLAANPDIVEDVALALGGLGVVWVLTGGFRRTAIRRAR